ncbi:LacI family DNA-binding transcriptional regulator [Gorillibacterium sp. sgz5001074]|uniref:LacI family DNA-binding transcriptional regulator n=1 Tax=Gorillibacterium sp. sgz5001074 TaxID=3446695 RepID=UPI003F66CBEA
MRSEDIARLAGVSRSTVSRVINNYPNVPDETRRKVMKIIEEHQYEPNTSARVLAGKGTDTIGLFIVSTAERPDVTRIYDNSYFARFVDAVVENANVSGSYVLIHTVYSRTDFLKVKQAFLQKRIDGGIIVGTGNDPEMIRELADLGSPMVLIDYDISDIIANRLDRNHLSVINSKDYDGALAVMNHLISLGHREIGFLAGRMDTFSGRERYKAYEAAMLEHGLRMNAEHMIRGDFLKQTAYEEAGRLLRSGQLPTALFSANDDMAIAAMQALSEHGVRVPEDLSIAGYDDVPAASLLTPKLTTVRLPIYDISRAAVEAIERLRQAGSASFGTISFPSELIIRESTRAPG